MPFLKLSFSLCCVCVFIIYTISINILCVSEEGLGLAESNQQRYMTSASELFLKSKDIRDLCKVIFLAGTKLLRLDKVRSIILLSKTTLQIWCDHIFTPKNKTTKKSGVNRGMDKIWKKKGRGKQYKGCLQKL